MFMYYILHAGLELWYFESWSGYATAEVQPNECCFMIPHEIGNWECD